jgi:hypothetical protein
MAAMMSVRRVCCREASLRVQERRNSKIQLQDTKKSKKTGTRAETQYMMQQ